MPSKQLLHERPDISNLSKSYYSLLTSIDWSDDLLLKGLREGLNKFLSNAYIGSFSGSKYQLGDYYSQNAFSALENGSKKNLVFEHMIPKTRYIQKPCEELARTHELSLDFIESLLQKYWKIAVITMDEDALLSRTRMPVEWNKSNVFARYEEAGIALIKRENLAKSF